MGMTDETSEVRITLRLPAGLRDSLAEAADKHSRSMNGEIVTRLEWTLIAHPHAPLIRALLDMKEDLLRNQAEFLVSDDVAQRLREEADRRGWSVEQLVTRLISGAVQHLDEKTQLGKQLEAAMDKHLKGTGSDE